MWFNKEAEAKKKIHMKRMDNTHDSYVLLTTARLNIILPSLC